MKPLKLHLHNPLVLVFGVGALVLLLIILVIPHAMATRYDRNAKDTATSTLDTLLDKEPKVR